MTSLTSSLDFQGQALSLRAERQRLLASNIANADTPGYVARDMDFASALRQATAASSGTPGAGTLAATQTGHVTSTMAMAGASDSRLLYATASQDSIDRNTVDMDRERANFADNAVKVEATLRFINADVKNMLDAIKGS